MKRSRNVLLLPANRLGLLNKGRLKVGGDTDIETLAILIGELVICGLGL